MSDASVSREECEAILDLLKEEQQELGLSVSSSNFMRLARTHLELLDLNDQDAEELRLIKADLLEIKVRVEELQRKSQWQPIETAPKDGDGIILIWTGSCVLPIGIYSLTLATDESTPEHLRLKPTHWMPLPDPPEAK